MATLASILASPRLAGLREWQGKKYPAQWPAIIDADTHERLARLLADRPRRAQVTGKRRHLLSGVARCGKCGRPLYADVNRYRCASGPGLGCGGCRGPGGHARGVRHRRRSRRPGIPARAAGRAAGADTDAPRRAELLAEIRKAQDKRAEARRDWAEDVIDKEDWLDIKQRTDDRINRARNEYDRLTGTATVFGDIPPSDAVRDAWQQWNTDRRRAAVKAVLNQVTVSPDTPGREGNPQPCAAGGRPAPADRIRLAALMRCRCRDRGALLRLEVLLSGAEIGGLDYAMFKRHREAIRESMRTPRVFAGGMLNARTCSGSTRDSIPSAAARTRRRPVCLRLPRVVPRDRRRADGLPDGDHHS